MKLKQWLSRLRMPTLSETLLVAVILMQWPLWFGQGGWLHVWRLEQELEERRARVQAQREQIEALEAEVRDLQTGLSAVEERARYELGLKRPGEKFFQFSGETNGASGSGQAPSKPQAPDPSR
ncbi:MAG: cell division protein FtsB [Pseudomonadota bacterium]